VAASALQEAAAVHSTHTHTHTIIIPTTTTTKNNNNRTEHANYETAKEPQKHIYEHALTSIHIDLHICISVILTYTQM